MTPLTWWWQVRFVNRLHFGFQEKTSETVLQQVTTPETLAKFVELKREMPAQRYFIVSPEFHRFVVSAANEIPRRKDGVLDQSDTAHPALSSVLCKCR